MIATKGFTLIELVIVILILGILGVYAVPKFINLSYTAKVRSLDQIQVSVKTANALLFYKSKLPSYVSKQVRVDLIDIDMNGDGLFTTFDESTGDIRLKWNYMDNTDVTKRIDISTDFVIQTEGIAYTFIGYDNDKDGKSKDDNCYFKYTQAADTITPPNYKIINSGC